MKAKTIAERIWGIFKDGDLSRSALEERKIAFKNGFKAAKTGRYHSYTDTKEWAELCDTDKEIGKIEAYVHNYKRLAGIF